MRAVATSVFLLFSLPLVCAVPAVAGPIEDAVQAYSHAEYAAALRLARPLAEAGNADAQYILGMAYLDGNGLAQDLVESYKWFELVVRSGDEDAVLDRDDVAKKLKPDQLAAAKKRADEWKPK